MQDIVLWVKCEQAECIFNSWGWKRISKASKFGWGQKTCLTFWTCLWYSIVGTHLECM